MIWIFLCILLSVVASELLVRSLFSPWSGLEVIILTQQIPPDIPIELRNKLIKMIENTEAVEPLDLSYRLKPDNRLPDAQSKIGVINQIRKQHTQCCNV